MNAEASDHRRQPKRWRVAKSSSPTDFQVPSGNGKALSSFSDLWPCLITRNIAALEEASLLLFWYRIRFGEGLEKLSGGTFPPLLPCCRAGLCPTMAPARGRLGFVFFPTKAFPLTFHGGLVLGQFWAFPTFSFILHPHKAFPRCFSLHLCVPLNGLA